MTIEPLEDRRLLAVITVNSAADDIVGGNGLVTLREAIIAANTDGPTDGGGTGSGPDVIQFAPALDGATITLNHAILGALPTIVESLAIDASALPAGLIINANDPSAAAGDGVRIFQFDDGAATLIDVTLNGLTLTGGDTSGLGGAVLSRENLLILNSVVTGNRASTDGGGIAHTAGDLTIVSSTIAGNVTLEDGGGLYSRTTGNVEITNSTISGNTAGNASGDLGGGLYIINANDVEITGSTISGNAAIGDGGGVFLRNNNSSALLSSTLSGNRTNGSGGGLYADVEAGQSLDVLHSTITLNTSDDDSAGGGSGGGIYLADGAGTVALEHTIVAGNTDHSNTAPDLDNTTAATQPALTTVFLLVGNNLGSTLAPSSLVGTDASPIDPLLAALANNGGLTQTHALLIGSPAIDAGNPLFLPPPANDQRGAPFPRVVGGRIDIGAFELEPPPDTLEVRIVAGELVISDRFAPPGTNSNVTLRRDGVVLEISAVNNTIDIPVAIPGASGDGANLVRVPLAAITGNRVVVDLDGGNDVLNVDITGGLLDFADGIWFDAGTGFDRLNILQSGGPVIDSETLVVGTSPGNGRHLLTSGAATQIVEFFNLEPFTTNAVSPVFNITSVPGLASVLQGGNQITYLPGSILADSGRIEIDSFESIEFVNKQSLILDAGSGDDTIVAVNGTIPTLLQTLTINAGSGNDVVRLEDLPGTPFMTTVNGEDGNDLLDASQIVTNSSITLRGQAGNDTLLGGAGADVLDSDNGDDILFASAGDDMLAGGTGVDVFKIIGRVLSDVITVNQTTATTLEVNFNGDARSHFAPNIEKVIIDAGLGDDLVAINVADLLAADESLPFEVIGNSPNASDRLIVNDDGLGDLVIHREGPDGRSGSVTVGQFAPVDYSYVERVDISPLDQVAGTTGTDNLGRLIVFDYDDAESNDSLTTAAPLGSVPVFLGRRSINPGGVALPPPFPQIPGDADWYEFQPGKIGTFRFEVLLEEIATLANGRAGLPGNGDLGIEVYRADGTIIAGADAPGNTSEVLDISMGANTSYFLRVFGSTADAINVYDLNVVEVDLLGPQVFDPDAGGPLGGIHVTDDPATAENEAHYNLFGAKSSDGPTPPITSLTVNLRDLLSPTLELRAPGDVYQALDALAASQSGLYQLVGDRVGPVAVASVIVTNNPVMAGELATATIELQFAEPLRDDRYTLTILDGLVDPPGNELDGESNAAEPQNPPNLPSGNGISGGNFVARFSVDSAAEIGTWAAGSVYLDLNGNFAFDPQSGDQANRDVALTLGFATDYLFAGNFVEDENDPANGFDKLAAYGFVGGRYRWLIDFTGTAHAFTPFDEPIGFNGTGTPVAGDFDGNPDNGDEIGLFTGTEWIFDTDHDFLLSDEVRMTSPLRGLPVVGDFDADGLDDLATWDANTNSFYFSESSQGGGPANPVITASFRIGNGFPFLGNRERPVAGDLDGDGFDELGLFVPDRSGVPVQEAAEWYLFSSKDLEGTSVGITDRVFRQEFGVDVLDFVPEPYGPDIFAQFGDEFALPIVGNFGPPTPSPTTVPLMGDYNLDDVVDDLDRQLWVSTFGSTTNLAADGNGDGRVDGADYTVWRDHFGAARSSAAASGPVSVVELATETEPDSGSSAVSVPWLDRAFENLAKTPERSTFGRRSESDWSNKTDLLLLLAERHLPSGDESVALLRTIDSVFEFEEHESISDLAHSVVLESQANR